MCRHLRIIALLLAITVFAASCGETESRRRGKTSNPDVGENVDVGVSNDVHSQPDGYADDVGPDDDTGGMDTGTPDTGPSDIGTPDAGEPDTGEPDTGEPDTGDMDAGGGDADAGESDPLEAPEDVTATMGTRDDGVMVSWSGVAGAVGYRVVRDDSASFEVGADVREYLDAQAAAPGALPTFESVLASSDLPEGVHVSWEIGEAGPGSTHEYVVLAIFESGTGQPSNPAQGWRGHPPVSFEVRVDGGQWLAVGADHEYLDEAAPYGTFEPGQTIATKGAHLDRVHLSIANLNLASAAQRSYQVRAHDGFSERLSDTVNGRRGLVAPQVQWERSSGQVASSFSAISGATSAPYGDLSAPADGTLRYFRARLNHPGGQAAYSTPDFGYRGVNCAVDRTFFGQIGGDGDSDGGVATTASLTHDANLEAIRDAVVPAPNWADPQELQPTIQVTGATVIATSFRTDRQFWLQDGHSEIQVFLDDPVPVTVRVGQRVSFRATHVNLFNGNPQVRSLTNFTIASADNPVPYIDLNVEPITLAEHYYRMIRVGGQLGPNSAPCGEGHTCYELFYGPTGARQSVEFRSASDSLAAGHCVTFIGPVIGYPGPLTTFPEPPAPQIETTSYRWHSASVP